jgi:DNA-binding transcriptional LysR family regulator
VRDGLIDAAIRAVPRPGTRLPEDLRAVRIDDEPIHLLVGREHALAARDSIRSAQLAGHRVWMPTALPDTEWGAFYAELTAEFGAILDTIGPGMSLEPVLTTVAGSATLATFVAERSDLHWPADYGLRRILLSAPTPVYPHALLWHADNPHPALAALREHLAAGYAPVADAWAPKWAV